MKCFHCSSEQGHTEECPTQKKAKCPPHRKGEGLLGVTVCLDCGVLWDDIPRLYAIAYEYKRGLNTWVPEFMYMHATSDGDARVQFFSSQSPHLHMRIVGIAPVLGFLVDDKHGEELTA